MNVQRDSFEKNAFIIRLEHRQQSYAQSEPVAVDLQKIFPEIEIVSFAEYYLSKLFSIHSARRRTIYRPGPS